MSEVEDKNADVWSPKALQQFSVGDRQAIESFLAAEDQLAYTLQTFAYVVGSGSLQVYQEGHFLNPGIDFVETSPTSFSISNPIAGKVEAGDIITAVGATGSPTVVQPGTGEIAGNTIWTEFAVSIGALEFPGAAVGFSVFTNYYDGNHIHGSGAHFKYTGTIDAGKAGNSPNIDGFFYDLDGKQWAVANLVRNPFQFGAVANGVINDSPALQAVWNSFGDANVVIHLGLNVSYLAATAIDWRVSTLLSDRKVTIRGDGVTIDFRGSGITSGDLIQFGATSNTLVNEHSKFVINGFTIIGTEDQPRNDSNAASTSVVGLSTENALGLNMQEVVVRNCYIGGDFKWIFPLTVMNCSFSSNFIGAYLIEDLTVGSWIDNRWGGCRFGLVLDPPPGKTIYGQTFIRCINEGNKVGTVLASDDTGGQSSWDIDFIDPYTEAIIYDAFRIQRTWNPNDAADQGVDATRAMIGLRITGGVWSSPAAWGDPATHQAIRLHDVQANSNPSGIRLDISVRDLSESAIGFGQNVTKLHRPELFYGQTDESKYEFPMLRSLKPIEAFSGIEFQDAGPLVANVNTLDYYKELAFTPRILFGGSDTGITYSTQNGQAVRIGKMVWFQIQLTITDKGAENGAAQLEDLPWTAVGANVGGPVVNRYQNMAISGDGITAQVQGDTTRVNLFDGDTTDSVALDDSNFTDFSVIVVSGCYIASNTLT